MYSQKSDCAPHRCEPERVATSHRNAVVRPSAGKEQMRLKVDRENDAFYLRLDDAEIVEFEGGSARRDSGL